MIWILFRWVIRLERIIGVGGCGMEGCSGIRLGFSGKGLGSDWWLILEGLWILVMCFEVELSLKWWWWM